MVIILDTLHQSLHPINQHFFGKLVCNSEVVWKILVTIKHFVHKFVVPMKNSVFPHVAMLGVVERRTKYI